MVTYRSRMARRPKRVVANAVAKDVANGVANGVVNGVANGVAAEEASVEKECTYCMESFPAAEMATRMHESAVFYSCRGCTDAQTSQERREALVSAMQAVYRAITLYNLFLAPHIVLEGICAVVRFVCATVGITVVEKKKMEKIPEYPFDMDKVVRCYLCGHGLTRYIDCPQVRCICGARQSVYFLVEDPVTNEKTKMDAWKRKKKALFFSALIWTVALPTLFIMFRYELANAAMDYFPHASLSTSTVALQKYLISADSWEAIATRRLRDSEYPAADLMAYDGALYERLVIRAIRTSTAQNAKSAKVCNPDTFRPLRYFYNHKVPVDVHNASLLRAAAARCDVDTIDFYFDMLDHPKNVPTSETILSSLVLRGATSAVYYQALKSIPTKRDVRVERNVKLSFAFFPISIEIVEISSRPMTHACAASALQIIDRAQKHTPTFSVPRDLATGIHRWRGHVHPIVQADSLITKISFTTK